MNSTIKLYVRNFAKRGSARSLSPQSLSPELASGFVAICDAAVLLLVGLVPVVLNVGGQLGQDRSTIYLPPSVMGAGLMIVILLNLGLYKIDWVVDVYRQLPRLMAAWAASVLTVLFFGFLLQVLDQYSRLWALIWVFGSFAGLVATRAAVCQLVRHWIAAGLLARRAVIVGDPQEMRRLLDYLRPRDGQDFHILGLFSTEPETGATSGQALPGLGYSVIGTVDGVTDFLRETRVDDVFVALPWSDGARINALISQLRMLPVDVRLVSDALVFCKPKLTATRFGTVTVLEVARRPLRDWDGFAKRCMDIAIAGTALLVLAPLMALVVVAIKLDSPGPVIFRQKRFGFNNSVIEALKFRTMYHDRCDASGAARTVRQDPRVTRVGHFLRASSLDEVPQLINVLRGEMSVIGPRAHPIAMKAGDQLYHEAVAEYAARHRVRPGLTGWAQVNGLRGEIDSIEKANRRVEFDLYYIENWSIWFDIRILIRTLITVLRQGAY
ncbi:MULTISPECIES: undecaprenyl-phosphate glucose phosphotransferase [unclassified Azospirillum]|uniref:undecaprenyl-phosphate glucose phosphotransferase n=1 Tax=unclassified Azospirillum TaxID=2630922 RepID=UPI001304BBBB|nr:MULTISPECIES: undecaprenyl-phosphate glucose phosphotransferase [unclassified Azospirillum]